MSLNVSQRSLEPLFIQQKNSEQIPEKLLQEVALLGEILLSKVVKGIPIFVYANKEGKIQGAVFKNGLLDRAHIRDFPSSIDLTDGELLKRVKASLQNDSSITVLGTTLSISLLGRGGVLTNTDRYNNLGKI